MFYLFTPFGLQAAAEPSAHEANLGRGLSLVVAGTLKAIAWAADLVAEWQARARSRRELMALDDRTLQDIGVSRGDAYMEYSKPFWR
jgi:uncharacterized protein YjiS (DUF1127 family)